MNQQEDSKFGVRQWGAGLVAAAALGGGLFFATVASANAQQSTSATTPAAEVTHVEMDEEYYDDFHNPCAQVAALLGIDEEALYAELDAGKSLAAIAAANNVDPQAVIDLLVAEEVAWVDELVAEGEISAEEAIEWKAELATEIAFDVNTAYVDPYMA